MNQCTLSHSTTSAKSFTAANELSNIIKGNLSAFYNQNLTSDVIESISTHLWEDFKKFLKVNLSAY